MKIKPQLSLLLLTKNESKNIEKNFDWLKQCKSIKEIIIVDDNSTDNTANLCQKLASKNR